MAYKQPLTWCLATTLVLMAAPGVWAQEEEEEYDFATDEFFMQLEGGFDLSELSSVVVSATKKVQRQEDAPSVVSIVTFEDIQNRGYKTVGEALRAIPGLATIDDHVNYNVGVRGVFGQSNAPGEIFKVMINGQSVAFRPTSANVLGYELIPIDAVLRIEVIRGPTSALYGANAFLGVINIITKTVRDLRAVEGKKTEESTEEAAEFRNAVSYDGLFIVNEEASSLNHGASLTALGVTGEFEYLIAGTFNKTDRSGLVLPGRDDIDIEAGNTDGTAVGYPSPGYTPSIRKTYSRDPVSSNDIAQTGSGYIRLAHQSDNGTFILDGNFQYFDKHGEFQEYSRLKHNNRLSYYNAYQRLTYESPDKHGLSLTLSLAHAHGEPLSDETIARNGTTSTLERHVGYNAYDLLGEVSYARDANLLTVGVDYTMDHEQFIQIETIDAETGNSTLGTDYGVEDFNNLGVYAQWVWVPLKRVTFTLGTRADSNSVIACDAQKWSCIWARKDRFVAAKGPTDEDATITDQGHFQISSRAGLVYGIEYWDSYVKALYGSSFKPPSPYQLYHQPWSLEGGTAGSPTLKPQTAETYELMIGTKPAAGLHLKANFFYTTADDIVISLMESGQEENRNADVTSMGLELAADYTISTTMSVFANVSSILDARLSPKRRNETTSAWETSSYNTEIPLPLYADLYANAGFTYTSVKHLVAHLSLHYIGARNASLSNNTMYLKPIADTYELEPYMIVDATISGIGLEWLGIGQTHLALKAQYAPGGSFVEPGGGGIDIPGIPTRVFLSLKQEF